MRKRWLWFLLGAAVVGLLGTAWDSSFEASPGGSDLVSDLDTYIQAFKQEVRFRAAAENIWGNSTDDNGLNRVGSARVFIQTSAPTAIVGPGQYNSAGGSYDTANLSSTETGASTDDVGKGRLWVDSDGADGAASSSDDNQLYIWNETSNAFVAVTASPTSGPMPTRNLIYNGGFEVTDGTGDTSSTTVPDGWSTVGTTPDIAYTDPTAVSEGEGVAVKLTANGSVDQGVSQDLAGLKASTAYVIRARVRATAGDSCTLDADDGTSNPTDTTATTAAFETLEVDITTTSTPDTVTVSLLSDADTDVCEWDNVTAFEQAPIVAAPIPAPCFDSDTTTTTTYTAGSMVAVPGLSCAQTIPGPGYAIVVDAHIIADNESGALPSSLEVDLLEDCGGGASTVAWGFDGGATVDAADIADLLDVDISYVKKYPTPGTTCTYTLQAASAANGGAAKSNNGDADQTSSFTPASTLRVQVVPSG